MDIDKQLLSYDPISITLKIDWNKTTMFERGELRHQYIEQQLALDPNYVGWDFPEHFRSLHGGRIHHAHQAVSFDMIISTEGEIVSVRNNQLYMTSGADSHKSYKVMAIHENGRLRVVQVHRVVACTFLAIPKELKSIIYKLVINHKNDTPWCNKRSNLEWCSHRQNTIKAVQTGAIDSTSFKFTITQPGPLLGKEYYFFSKADLVRQKFSHAPIWESVRTGKVYLCGVWTEVTKEFIKDKFIGVPEEDLAIMRDKRLGRSDAQGYLGTIVSDGPCKGEQFVMFGGRELNTHGFVASGVLLAVSQPGRVYKNCVWVKITREDAVNIQLGINDKQKLHVFGKA